jgi:pyruvate kinase
MHGHYRHTKIIATIGPATESKEKLAELMTAGVNVLRLNMAHATGEWVKTFVKRAREVSAELGKSVSVMMDVKGPEIRTGAVAQPIELQAGDIFEFYTKTPTPGTVGVDVNYPGLPLDVKVGSIVLVDSGLMRLEVLEKDETHVKCRVLTPGRLGSRRHINLPGVDVNLPALTEKDERDLIDGIEVGIDFVALSFVRRGEDINTLRTFLDSKGSKARIIAKIEDQAGVRNLEEIVRATDSVMVARGDLGIEIDYHILPIVQSRIVEVCATYGKPVIIATHLLESMISAPMPTRAEISDISTAVRERADAIMLSGETTTGLYPLECVSVFKNIIKSIEPLEKRKCNDLLVLDTPKAKMLRAAAMLAQDLDHSGVIVFSRTGYLGYTTAAVRAQGLPIFAFTTTDALARQLTLPWGVEPFVIDFNEDPEVTIKDALAMLKERGWCDPGTWFVVITNALAHDKIIDTIQLRQVQ